MTGKITPVRKRDTGAVQAEAGAFLSSPRHTDPNTPLRLHRRARPAARRARHRPSPQLPAVSLARV
jgi:hypothetical protein